MLSPCTCSKLRQLNRKITNIYDSHLAAHGITVSQYSLLARIGRVGPIGLIPLALYMELERSTLSRSLKPLISAGWIATLDLPLEKLSSKRSFGVQLTASGIKKRDDCMPDWERAQEHIALLLGQECHLQLEEIIDQANIRLHNS